MSFRDREAAGAVLAETLVRYARRTDVVVLGLVRGGVPVAAMIARCLAAPVDPLVVRKLGVPWEPEVAFGAVGPGGVCVLNEAVDQVLEVADEVVCPVQPHDFDAVSRWYEEFDQFSDAEAEALLAGV